MRVRARAGVLAGLAGCTALAGPVAAAPPARAADAVKALTVQDDQVTESSGLAASARHPGVIYTHNDSGGSPRIFAIGSDGRTRATFTLSGATARDWEGMAIGKDDRGRPALFVADIGDNLGGAWPYITVYRVTEPGTLRDQTLRATAFRLRYEDGPRNAESVMINPRTNRLYIASKLFAGSLYAAPARLRAGRTNTLRKVGDAPALATDAAFAPDGRSYVIRTYFSAHVYAFANGKPGDELRTVSIPAQEQGESITYTPDGLSLLAGSEGTRQPVWRISLPAAARPSSSATPTASSRDDSGRRGSSRTGLFIAVAVAGAVGFAFLRRRRA